MAAESTNTSKLEVTRLKEGQLFKGESLMQMALRRLRHDRLTLIAISVLVVLALLAAFAPVITDIFNVSYTHPDSDLKFLPIGAPGHPLGTDHLGRDMLARLLYGGRVSLTIGVVAAFFCGVIGVSVGLVAGFYRGSALSFVDDAIMWFITTLNSIPTLLLLILIASVADPTIPTLIFVLTLVSWTGIMRLIRGETISNREQEYVISARAIGAGPLRIMFIHILPNTLSVLLTALAIQIGTIILVESALSFLGLGVRPPEPSWGNMLTSAQSYFRQGPQISILPGLLIVITVLSLYLIGDGLRDAFDPRSTK
ncbi:MAG: ABC transporter permease [Anaerolineaceae bacterium]|nr:ABC transporter permease [Anaerolineaceae bacterium]